MGKKRIIGFDYLRIVCMIWIILHHFAFFSGYESISNEVNLSLNYYAGIFFFSGGDIANGVFILITGYLLYDKSFNLNRWIKLIMQVMFYSVFSWGIAILLNAEPISLYVIYHMLFPFRSNAYWFISTYIVLCPLFPMFSRVIKETDVRKISYCLVYAGVIFAILPLLGYDWLTETNSIAQFIYIFLVGCVIKKYQMNGFKKMQVNVFIFIITLFGICISVPILTVLHQYVWILAWGINLLTITCSVFFFFLIKNWSRNASFCEKMNAVCGKISGYVFGVYLFHNGRLLPLLLKIFNIDENLYLSNYYVIYMLGVSIVVFVLGVTIDFIRSKLIGQIMIKMLMPLIKVINKCLRFLDRKLLEG